MDVLHAPWRMDYINSPKDQATTKPCIFCQYPTENDDVENLIVFRGHNLFVMMNRYPYSSGHLMVIPYRHTADFTSLTQEESAELAALTQKSIRTLRDVLHAAAFNLGMNLGKAAGAGIDTHLHLHVVPRWEGDTNFMSVTAETKVLPESLSTTWERLSEAWRKQT